MSSYSVAHAKSQLSKLIDEAQSGATVTITRHGKPAAELSAPAELRAARRKMSQVEAGQLVQDLSARRKSRPSLGESGTDIIRKMRDGEY